jgi:hypothetical protein
MWSITGVTNDHILFLRTLSRDDILENLSPLSDILADCVNGGASVSFMLPFSRQTARAFWLRIAESVAAGERLVWWPNMPGRLSARYSWSSINRKTSLIAPTWPNFWFTKMRGGRGWLMR